MQYGATTVQEIVMYTLCVSNESNDGKASTFDPIILHCAGLPFALRLQNSLDGYLLYAELAGAATWLRSPYAV